MRFLQAIWLVALVSARLYASSLTFSLTPPVESQTPETFPVSVDFAGALTDTDTTGTCDTDNVHCLYLNYISFSFDQPTGTSNLTGDVEDFYLYVPGILSDDGAQTGLFNTYTGNIFGIVVAPNTPLGIYTGSASIYGGYDNPSANILLATANWTVDVVAPEPANFGLAFIGVLAVVLAKRRVPA